MSWEIVLSRQAAKDAKKIAQAGLKPQAEKLLKILAENPYTNPPPYEKLVGKFARLLFQTHFNSTPLDL